MTNTMYVNASDLAPGDVVVVPGVVTVPGAYKTVQGVTRHPLNDGSIRIRVDYGRGHGAMFKPTELVEIVDN